MGTELAVAAALTGGSALTSYLSNRSKKNSTTDSTTTYNYGLREYKLPSGALVKIPYKAGTTTSGTSTDGSTTASDFWGSLSSALGTGATLYSASGKKVGSNTGSGATQTFLGQEWNVGDPTKAYNETDWTKA